MLITLPFSLFPVNLRPVFISKSYEEIIMSRVCDVTGRKPMFGNHVSHAHNKTRRRFNVNLQKKRFWLPDEKRYITLNVSTRGMRIIDKKGIRRVVNELRARGMKI